MPIIGSRIAQAVRTLQAPKSKDITPDVDRLYRKGIGKSAASRRRSDVVTLITQIAFSLVVLSAALYVVLSRRYDTDTQKWAFGTIGVIVGYWLG